MGASKARAMARVCWMADHVAYQLCLYAFGSSSCVVQQMQRLMPLGFAIVSARWGAYLQSLHSWENRNEAS